MKTRSWGKIILILAICLGAGFCTGYYGTKLVKRLASPADGEYGITVCSTTDIHGAYFDKDFDGTPKKNSLADIAAFLKEVRSDGTDPILIDCGDNLQGSNAAYYFNYVDTLSKHVFTAMQQYLGYDVLVVGNHDFETGHPVYDRIRKEAGIPMLAANALKSDGKDAGKPYFDEYTIIRRGKIKIAVIGMTNPNIKNWLAEPLWKGIDFVTIASVAQEVIDRVNEKEKPHLTILAMHSGKGEETPNIESEGLFLANTLTGVNLILCGHDHRASAEVVSKPSGETLIIDSGNKGNFATRADFNVLIEKGCVKSVEIKDFKIADMNEYDPDPEFVAAFEPQFAEISDFANKKICQLNGDIDFSVPEDGSNEYLTLIHKTQLYVTGADISFAAPLSWDGGVKAGDISFNGLSKIYVFENTLNTIKLTGKQIKDYLEFSYDNWINGTAAKYNLDCADGINYIVDKKREKGNRVEISSLTDGRPFCLDSTYTVALTSYRASGGGYHLRDGAGVDPHSLETLAQYKDIRSLIGEYMKSFANGYDPVASDNWHFKK